MQLVAVHLGQTFVRIYITRCGRWSYCSV